MGCNARKTNNISLQSVTLNLSADIYMFIPVTDGVISGFRRCVNDIFVLLEFLLDSLTLEGGIDRLSRNVGHKLPIYASQNPRTAYISDLE
jgi:hypothetical protein